MKRVLTAALFAVVAGPSAAATLYVQARGTNDLYTVDVDAGTASLVGNAGIGLGFGGLGFAQDGTLYGWTTSTNSLYTVDKGSGAWSLVGGGATSGGDGFDIDPLTGEAVLFSTSGFYDVDLATGATTLRAGSAPFLASAAFAPDGTLYGFQFSGPDLVTADLDSGIATPVGTAAVPTVTSLGFNPEDSFLYAIGADTGELFRIDPATAATTNLGVPTGLPVPDGSQYTMATFAAADTDARIPLPATLPLLAGALAGIGLLSRRRAPTG